jgi:hypothetical protein
MWTFYSRPTNMGLEGFCATEERIASSVNSLTEISSARTRGTRLLATLTTRTTLRLLILTKAKQFAFFLSSWKHSERRGFEPVETYTFLLGNPRFPNLPTREN